MTMPLPPEMPDPTDPRPYRLRRRAVAGLIAALAALALLALSTPAGAHYAPRDGESIRDLTRRVCGSDASWRDQAARNRLATTGPRAYWVYLGVRYDIVCPGGSSSSPSSATPAPSSGWSHPLPGSCRSARGGVFGIPHDHNGDGVPEHYHAGIDLGSGRPVGTPVHAAAAGTITAAGSSGDAGRRIILSHGSGVTTRYHHLSSYRRTSGSVAAGEVIGYMGATGNATGPHLHFEVRIGGTATDPVPYLRARGVPIAC